MTAPPALDGARLPAPSNNVARSIEKLSSHFVKMLFQWFAPDTDTLEDPNPEATTLSQLHTVTAWKCKPIGSFNCGTSAHDMQMQKVPRAGIPPRLFDGAYSPGTYYIGSCVWFCHLLMQIFVTLCAFFLTSHSFHGFLLITLTDLGTRYPTPLN